MEEMISLPFERGQEVEDKNSPGKRGIFTGQYRKFGAILMVEVHFHGESRPKFSPCSNLKPHDTPKSPLDKLRENEGLGFMEDLRHLLAYEKLKGTLNDILYSMDAAQIDFYPYQYKPVLKFINSPSERLLLADEVGLGKTIEAALIWLEMKARYRAKRLLVLCPKILTGKWRDELLDRFAIKAEIVDFHGFESKVGEVCRYGDSYPFALIASYSGLRPPKPQTRSQKKKDKPDPKTAMLQKLRDWSESYPVFDMVIFDEAHCMRNQETMNFRLGKCLSASEVSRGVLYVSATPINNRNVDLHSLLSLMDEEFFSSQRSFEDLVQENSPVVRLSNALCVFPPDGQKLLAALEDMKRISRLSSSPYFPELEKNLNILTRENGRDKKIIVKCQDMAEKMNAFSPYVNRTRRVQVTEKRPLRDVKSLVVEYTDEEMELYLLINDLVRKNCAIDHKKIHFFQIMSYQLMAASSLPAFAEKIQRDEQNKTLPIEDVLSEAIDDVESEGSAPEFVREIAQAAKELINVYDFTANDSKFTRLKDFLQDLAGEKVIVFSFYRGTLHYLQKRLADEGMRTALIHGDIPLEERQEEIEGFRSPDGAQILLSSEVGSEGIDLQFCRVLVNYDLPWNPMRVEQRIGRIDRVGQEAEKLIIANFKIAGTIEEKVYTRLYEKLDKFRSSLGEIEEVIGREIRQLIHDVFTMELTDEERDQRIYQTEQAIERNRQDMIQLEEDSPGLMGLGDYVQEKIREDKKLGRYVRSVELADYVTDFFGRHYQGTIINHNYPEDGCMGLDLSPEAHEDFCDYIDREKIQLMPEWRRARIRFTFDREVYKKIGRRKKVLFANHLSPFIKWITSIHHAEEHSIHNLSAITASTPKLEPGIYLYRIERLILKGIINMEKLIYGFISLETGKCVLSDEAESVFQDILGNGRSWIYRDYPREILEERYESLERALHEQIGVLILDFDLENRNFRQIKTERLQKITEKKLEVDAKRLVTLEERKRSDQVKNMTRKKMEKTRAVLETKLREYEEKATVNPEFSTTALGLVLIK